MNETTGGAPLTATVGERVGDDPHVKEVQEAVARSPAGRRAAPGGRRFPWATLALAAIGWAALTGLGGALRARAGRLARGVRRLTA